MSERIDHVEKALSCIRHTHSIINEFEMAPHMRAVIELDEARLHAQLALVEQQRIANLIALGEVWVPGTKREPWDFDGPEGEMKQEVKEALGLD